ncbi:MULTISPECIES: hypothetical protein [Clostridium]|uniref:hypothetical protein n=1 Tax=Clostridium TaxID=1485 RepID=UPI0008267A69|nr:MULTISPECIES: hypothetical protein [Clostridium]PJI09389.1 hypothetical protein CUB90_16535 [Clostridium sp. CT7]
MIDRKSFLKLNFHGDVFKEINNIISDENERLKTVLILSSEQGDYYKKIFDANSNITFCSREVFGDIIIDDNHIIIKWNSHGHEIEFYFEECWGIIELTIDTEEAGLTIKEIEKAFENYYGRQFYYNVSREETELTGNIKYSYMLEISE